MNNELPIYVAIFVAYMIVGFYFTTPNLVTYDGKELSFLRRFLLALVWGIWVPYIFISCAWEYLGYKEKQ